MANAVLRNANRQSIRVRVRRCALRKRQLCNAKEAYREEGRPLRKDGHLRRHLLLTARVEIPKGNAKGAPNYSAKHD